MVKSKAPTFADLLLAIPLAVEDLRTRRPARIMRERADCYLLLGGMLSQRPPTRQDSPDE